MSTLTVEKYEQKQFDLFTQNLPRTPYCTDKLADGLLIETKERALKKRYIQYNPPAHDHKMVFDIDRRFNRDDFSWLILPDPNVLITNPQSGRPHAVYYIGSPVCTSGNARPGPIRYQAAIYEGIREKLQADAGYVQLICKNPLSSAWHVDFLHDKLFELSELAEYVDLKAATGRLKRRPYEEQTGLGRHCSLFDRLRHWAYQWVKEYKNAGCDVWLDRVREQADRLNTFDPPLPNSSIRSTAKSVATWTWKHYGRSYGRSLTEKDLAAQGMTPETFSLVQSNLGRMGNEKRWAHNEGKPAQAIQLLAQGVKKVEIAKQLQVSRPTLDKWIKASGK